MKVLTGIGGVQFPGVNDFYGNLKWRTFSGLEFDEDPWDGHSHNTSYWNEDAALTGEVDHCMLRWFAEWWMRVINIQLQARWLWNMRQIAVTAKSYCGTDGKPNEHIGHLGTDALLVHQQKFELMKPRVTACLTHVCHLVIKQPHYPT